MRNMRKGQTNYTDKLYSSTSTSISSPPTLSPLLSTIARPRAGRQGRDRSPNGPRAWIENGKSMECRFVPSRHARFHSPLMRRTAAERAVARGDHSLTAKRILAWTVRTARSKPSQPSFFPVSTASGRSSPMPTLQYAHEDHRRRAEARAGRILPAPLGTLGRCHQHPAATKAALRHRKTPRDRRRFGRRRSRSPQGEPAGLGGRIKPSSRSCPGNGRSGNGFPMTNRRTSGTKPPGSPTTAANPGPQLKNALLGEFSKKI